MSTKHTPGPWEVDYEANGQPRRIMDAEGEHITYIDGSRYLDGRSDPEAEANAALMADAPAMLEALRDVADSNRFADSDPIQNRITAILERHQ